MPVENFNDNFPNLAAAIHADRQRRGAVSRSQPYATDEFIYWVNADGMICFGQRASSNAIAQYIRRTGESIMHPDLREAGWCFIDEACESEDEFAAIRKHMDAHQKAKDKGRRSRVIFSPPMDDVPSKVLRMQIASGFLGDGERKRKAEEILEARSKKDAAPAKEKKAKGDGKA